MPALLFYTLVDAPSPIGAPSLAARPAGRAGTRPRSFLGALQTPCFASTSHGQITIMGVLALYYPLALMCTGLKLAWPIGVFTGLAVFIPTWATARGWCWR